MPGCAVNGCRNYNRATKGSNIRYYRFPKDEALTKQWIAACQREDVINTKNACICSTHFEASCFETSFKQKLSYFASKNWRDLKSDAVPTLHLGKTNKRQSENIEHYTQEEKSRKIDIGIPITSKLIVKNKIPTKPNTKQPTDLFRIFTKRNCWREGNEVSSINKDIMLEYFAEMRKKNKAKVLEKELIDEFVKEAPDDEYLAEKVVLIMGIARACCCNELTNLSIDHIEDKGSYMYISIADTKTNKAEFCRHQ
ncbi:THAP domain [Popillia japonica]|uniref:THAP domain n=1 Tax=Popillia japonica TaxID=7064 RepID=A0AAW1KN75_POPJA